MERMDRIGITKKTEREQRRMRITKRKGMKGNVQ